MRLKQPIQVRDVREYQTTLRRRIAKLEDPYEATGRL